MREGVAMWIGLLWIIGCYGLSVAILHFIFGLTKAKPRQSSHFLLITKNNGLHIEWYIRSLHVFSWLRGRQVKVTILDEGSTDDTLPILERMAGQARIELEFLASGTSTEEWLSQFEEGEIRVIPLSGREYLVEMQLCES